MVSLELGKKIRESLIRIFTKKKKKTTWQGIKQKEEEVYTEAETEREKEVRVIRFPKIKIPTIRTVLKIPAIRKVKRGLCGLLLLLHFLFGIFSLSLNVFASLLFFATDFFLIDYLWKTKRGKIEWPKPKFLKRLKRKS